MNAALQRLRAELAADRRLFEARIEELAGLPALVGASPAVLAQAAVALHHAYGALEGALARVVRVLEGSLPEGRDWHQALLGVVVLDIEGVRPAILSHETVAELRRLLGFRHFFRHAYGAPLDPQRLEELRGVAVAVRARLRAELDALDDLLRTLAERT